MRKVIERLQTTDGDDIGASLKAVGMALVSRAARPARSTARSSCRWARRRPGAPELDLAAFTDAFDAGLQGAVAREGRARRQDHGRRAHSRARGAVGADGDDVAAALERAAQAAHDGMEATVPMVARKGRASYLGERSADHQDPGRPRRTSC